MYVRTKRRAGGKYRPIGWIGFWYVNTHTELAASGCRVFMVKLRWL